MAAELDVPVTLGAAARQVYSIARAKGRGREDWTAIYTTARTLAGRD